jgi:hypothetical protein
MAGAVKIVSGQSDSARKIVLGAPLAAALVFSFAFVLFSAAPLDSHRPTSTSIHTQPTLLLSPPKPTLTSVAKPEQKKLEIVTGADSNIMNSTKTASPQAGAGSSHSLQAADKSQVNRVTQSLLNRATKLTP